MPAPVWCRIRRLELGANTKMVVDLAVESDCEAPALAAHRLRAGLRQLENGQPAMPERNARGRVDPDPARIGPAMRKPLRHARGHAGQHFALAAAGPEQACYAAHG